MLDSSKEAIADNRHRVLTHHNWFVKRVLQRVFGDWIIVSTTPEGNLCRSALHAEDVRHKAAVDEILEQMRSHKYGRVVSVAQIGEDHILEDYVGRFIPTAQDYVVDGQLQLTDWMNNGRKGHPSSYNEIAAHQNVRTIILD